MMLHMNYNGLLLGRHYRIYAIANHLQKRFKKKRQKPTESNTERAMKYFDVSYPPIYRARWPSIRLALMSQQKYMAVINNFSNYEPVIEKLEDLGAKDIREKYSNIIYNMNASKREQEEPQSTVGLTDDQRAERPSLKVLSDEEKAAKAKEVPEGVYPEEYRNRLRAKGVEQGEKSIDASLRLIVPSEGGVGLSVLQDYIPSTKLKGLEEWQEETDVFVERPDSEIGIQIEKQSTLISLPEMLKVYSFDKGDISDFPRPQNDPELNVLNCFIMDGASLLPVLALDIEVGERVLDMCAAPGGKSLIALQTLLPGLVVSNDSSHSRYKRIHNVLRQYIPKSLDDLQKISAVTCSNGCLLDEQNMYDKVLVDAPCLTDRHVLHVNENSIFRPSRVKERLAMPELQTSLLYAALHKVRPGGSVVYSTCTLSPLQNDGVVHMALSRIWQETTIECKLIDLSHAVRPLAFMYRFGNNIGLRYGQMVLPSVLSNFGPMYFSKITRIR